MAEELGRTIDIRSRPFYKLLLLSAAVGVLGALLLLAFFFALRYGTDLI